MAEFDLVVIGGGPGGYVAAIRACQLGMNTALVEEGSLGGICTNWGCIPTKALLKSADIYNNAKEAKKYGIGLENLSFDLPAIVKRSRRVANRLRKGVEFLMKKNEITVFDSRGVLDEDANVVLATGEILKAKNIILATGGRPISLQGVGIDETRIITSRTAMTLEEFPDSIAIIGGGAIGVEFAHYFSSFGVDVTIIEMMPFILPMEDEEISTALCSIFERRGINILTRTSVKTATVTPQGVNMILGKVASQESFKADMAMLAAGVTGNVENLGLKEADVKIDGRFIKVDDLYRTTRAGVWAIGDMIGPPQLAHVASAEGVAAVEVMAGKRNKGLDYSGIPSCTYCQPQVASFGITETQAIHAEMKVKIGRFPFRANGKALALGEDAGMVKLIFDENYKELLGAHILGYDATEMISELALGKTHGATYKSILDTVHPHPTMSEAVGEAAGEAFGEAINI